LTNMLGNSYVDFEPDVVVPVAAYATFMRDIMDSVTIISRGRILPYLVLASLSQDIEKISYFKRSAGL